MAEVELLQENKSVQPLNDCQSVALGTQQTQLGQVAKILQTKRASEHPRMCGWVGEMTHLQFTNLVFTNKQTFQVNKVVQTLYCL